MAKRWREAVSIEGSIPHARFAGVETIRLRSQAGRLHRGTRRPPRARRPPRRRARVENGLKFLP